jgi:hypothetical protein
MRERLTGNGSFNISLARETVAHLATGRGAGCKLAWRGVGPGQARAVEQHVPGEDAVGLGGRGEQEVQPRQQRERWRRRALGVGSVRHQGGGVESFYVKRRGWRLGPAPGSTVCRTAG